MINMISLNEKHDNSLNDKHDKSLNDKQNKSLNDKHDKSQNDKHDKTWNDKHDKIRIKTNKIFQKKKLGKSFDKMFQGRETIMR